jgi:hypothetical protein
MRRDVARAHLVSIGPGRTAVEVDRAGEGRHVPHLLREDVQDLRERLEIAREHPPRKGLTMFDTAAFLRSVRGHFHSLFERFGLVEVDARESSSFASLTAANRTRYVRVSIDIRDQRVSMILGRRQDGEVPEPVLFAPRSVDEVREFDLDMLLWLHSGNRDGSRDLGQYESEDPAAVDAVVEELAALAREHAGPLLAGDPVEWANVAQLMLLR